MSLLVPIGPIDDNRCDNTTKELNGSKRERGGNEEGETQLMHSQPFLMYVAVVHQADDGNRGSGRAKYVACVPKVG